MPFGDMQDFWCMDSIQVLENILPCFWVAMALRWSKSSPKEDWDLPFSICPLWMHDLNYKNFVLRFNRKAVLIGVEAVQCWRRLRSSDVKTIIHLQKEIYSLFNFELDSGNYVLCLFPLPSCPVAVSSSEIICLLAVMKEKSSYCLGC